MHLITPGEKIAMLFLLFCCLPWPCGAKPSSATARHPQQGPGTCPRPPATHLKQVMHGLHASYNIIRRRPQLLECERPDEKKRKRTKKSKPRQPGVHTDGKRKPIGGAARHVTA